jgi:hypothetical protein
VVHEPRIWRNGELRDVARASFHDPGAHVAVYSKVEIEAKTASVVSWLIGAILRRIHPTARRVIRNENHCQRWLTPTCKEGRRMRCIGTIDEDCLIHV